MTSTPDPDELVEIEERLSAALDVAPQPWVAFLETRAGIGGSSFIQVGGSGSPGGDEMYLELHIGGERVRSPDPRLDAILDLIAHAPADLARLLGEVRRLAAE